ncbi:IMP dehydrogenase [Hylemonella gracilis str. Niagara R]|uniref:IMP dehydrogenase n=1 Tax=Hylemonella gracilis str. Niagara R TaxID=1458275 RepID=A0A016XI13_9BURK|nr:transglutaminase family protein [Hylemonella gracilis]EYC51739.1 IMP dehydrogenase [Hylemonella gracilis str. Niagara R]
MSIHAALQHITHYKYDRPVQLGPQTVRLRPAPHCRSKIVSYSLRVEPTQHFINWQQDPFANYQARLVFPEKTTEFTVAIDLVVEMAVYNPFDFFLEPEAEHFPFSYSPALREELAPYLVAAPLTPLLRQYLDGIDRERRRTVDFLVALNQKLQTDIQYLIRLEPGVQTPEETLRKASGSCRDSGWLLVNLLRHCGLAARFVSGYLIQLTPDVKAIDGPSGTTVDFTDLHAWCEVYLPGAGWIGLDPTSGLMAGEGHIPLACTPQPSSAAPIEGLFSVAAPQGAGDEAEVEFSHHMQVTRIHESARVTKPYTDAQWDAIMALGEQVEVQLQASDVRLTMGGEPTFVATSDRDAPEWNTDALGPTKRGYATELVHKLRTEYGQGGFLHFGQGKWYPGEQLPRWALSIFWRADGEPIWQDPSLFADERVPAHYGSEDARVFTHTLAGKLGLNTRYIQPGYEDTWYYLWRERRLPVNVDPFDARLEDELERQRLRRVFSQKLDAVVGYALPLQTGAGPTLAGSRWSTGPWFFRDERMYLVPGDSAMGYRLPLDSLPWVGEGDYPWVIQQDPYDPRPPLPHSADIRAQYTARRLGGNGGGPGAMNGDTLPAGAGGMGAGPANPTATAAAALRQPQRFESAHWITRTALCVEARDPMRANGPKTEREQGGKSGLLYVFMPPLARLEDYLDLLSAVEATAAELGVKIVLEGYPPPRDARLKMLQVTPDPGVIEVNIHPSHNWAELVQRTEFLYQAAFETHLCAEKFMTDGRHTGTGGGNHFVLGGATPADSPFLRRPELLASLLLYWHNHPSLSYLFSGLFIGPTSQAPRVDEARNDQLYELEIALREIQSNRQKYGQDMPPWLLDRTLRNILIDVTGNTHRSEFCIDKMYSPDGPTGRLGLLELRAFEMPPHARMSIAQQLLLRALVARFWNQPYQALATRWGTELHDRFLLPTFVRMDFADVLQEMRQAGYAFDDSWFTPHFEFRFPLAGELQMLGMTLTLRNALEPWHVMGEEGAAGGTVRYVDSSLERIEVRVTGLNPSRHTVTVNGRPLPLQPTGTVGEYVAGVRYKAWNPPSSLHPTIGVHAPLVFDLVDTWMQRSLGGCQYHVAHPGGRNYITFPINAYEAESRRLARFSLTRHTHEPLPVLPATQALPGSREFPCTLDLRN